VDEVGDLPLDCVLEVKATEQSTLRALEPFERPPDRTLAAARPELRFRTRWLGKPLEH
jgi:hypothetical protein